jgi:ADP-ribose pyrophosphatase YjhB (NUDIX family)
VRYAYGRDRRVCPACAHVDYDQLKVGAAALVLDRGRLLLVRRAIEPFAGDWSLPAGYVEADEAPEAAVVREVAEETGLRVEVVGLRGVYFFADDPRGNGILIAFECRAAGGELRATDEAVASTFFARGELPQRVAGAGHDQAVDAWRGG